MKEAEQQAPEDVEVRLRPFLGVEPRTYVPILYGTALLVLLVLVFVVPGIRRHGSMVTVITTPADASLVVDGVRRATTPGTVFISSGTRTMEIRRPGFDTYRSTVDIGGRLIGSWIVPHRTTIRVELEGADVQTLARAGLTEFAEWSLAGEASGQYQLPPIAREAAADIAAATSQGTVVDAWEDFVADGLPQVASQALLNDLAAASLIAGGGEGPVAVPSGIAQTVQLLARVTSDNRLLPLQLASAAGPDGGRLVRETPWFRAAIAMADELSTRRLDGAEVPIGAPREYPLGLSFVELRGGEAVLGGAGRARRGGDMLYEVTLAPFFVGATELPFSAYETFLEANPAWSDERVDELIAAGLVDGGYLREIDAMREVPERPVTGVSAFAAEAFAEWYTTLLPEGLEARLPTEAEWEYAMRVSGADGGIFFEARTDGPVPVSQAGTGRGGLTGMLGNVWEWTGDWFAPYTAAHGGEAPGAAAHRVVRGGGWGTDWLGFNPSDRGSLDPSWCSSYVGIRLVLAPTSGL